MESDSDTARYLNISRENSASESMNREKERESVSLSHDKERHDHRRKAVPTKSDRRNWSATKATPTCTSQERESFNKHILRHPIRRTEIFRYNHPRACFQMESIDEKNKILAPDLCGETTRC